jgi:hypothetical protein
MYIGGGFAVALQVRVAIEKSWEVMDSGGKSIIGEMAAGEEGKEERKYEERGIRGGWVFYILWSVTLNLQSDTVTLMTLGSRMIISCRKGGGLERVTVKNSSGSAMASSRISIITHWATPATLLMENVNMVPAAIEL